MKFVMLVLPALAIVAFVALKLPPNMKDHFFKIPIWLSSTAIAWMVSSRVHGVMGGYAGILCDFILIPFFVAIKKHHEWSKARTAAKQEKKNVVEKNAPTQNYIPPSNQPAWNAT